MTLAVNIAQGGSNNVTMRNRIINGAMVINQRAFSGTPNNEYTLDRWVTSNSQTGKFTVSQSSTAPVGFINSLLATSSSAYTVGSGEVFLLTQFIEGLNITDLAWGTANAKTVTLSFQVYSSLTGTFGGSLMNSAADYSYPFSYSVPTANTWTTISVTIAGPTSGTWLTTNGAGIRLTFSLGSGSTKSSTAGSWASGGYYSATGAVSVVATSGATFYITGVQLEAGTTASPFEYRQYGTELVLCQRYCVLYAKATGGQSEVVGSGQAWTSSNFWCTVRMPVTMRSTPTMSATSGTNYWLWWSGGSSVQVSTILDPGYVGAANLGNLIYQTGTGTITAGQGVVLGAQTVGAVILYTAEL